ncbi:MAG: hypothetical protein J5910_07630 [Lachnospiraceae bacterium]|nr:hypothetical protein [Lachnospiraceae bacterium]
MIGINGYGNMPLSGYIYGGYQGSYGTGNVQTGEEAGKVGAVKNPGESTKVAPGRKSSPAECQTCKERKYQDGSDENVSFKSAQHIAPEAAGARVRAHEQEHVSNAYSKAQQQNGKVINASVTIHTAICPECGRTYVSGGTTHTQIKYNNEKNPYQQNKKANDAMGLVGQSIDLAG